MIADMFRERLLAKLRQALPPLLETAWLSVSECFAATGGKRTEDDKDPFKTPAEAFEWLVCEQMWDRMYDWLPVREDDMEFRITCRPIIRQIVREFIEAKGKNG